MLTQTASANNLKPRKIRRNHTGCKPCRRRGKRCDETRPCCQACARLSLECSYGVDFTFRNCNGTLLQKYRMTQTTPSRSATANSKPNVLDNIAGENCNVHMLKCLSELGNSELPPTLVSFADSLEASYFDHFQRHVRHLLPAASLRFTDGSFDMSPCLRFAVLCIAASNLSMLDARVQSRVLANDRRRSVFSPLVNNLHHGNARVYHDLALQYCSAANVDEIEREAPAFVAARVLLAYYHHASTDHLRFRLAVWDSVQFVLHNRTKIMASPHGADALQLWYRLCMSHRPAKPPALLLEGEGASSFGPNLLPDANGHLYMKCILEMNVDDLIYDILIKTMEIRTKMVVYRCVAGSCRISELSSEISNVAYEMLNKLLGRDSVPDETAEAREGFVRGSHLRGLLDVQKERLKVWKSRLNADQLPTLRITPSQMNQDASSMCHGFPTHRDAMNAVYCMLCEIAFEEANGAPPGGSGHSTTLLDNLADSICQIAGTLDFTMSNTWDVYTLSLTEVLLQLVLLWRSDKIFHYILDVLWPRLESRGRGYEHSHYPTHLVKRIITQIAAYWEQDRVITFALPAVAEDTSKLKLLDIDQPVDLVVCGYYNTDGKDFIGKISLP
ncbi:transcriptional regulator family: Fungal Specific TF [Paecilomyces variotii]|nr:transcriptional regulator family: Fungal Specific TF [Paecilomyces variotii]